VTFKTFGHLGDMFCLTSAAHTYARITKRPTYIDSDWGITEMYDDGLLNVGNDGDEFDMHGVIAHHRDVTGWCGNYLGCYLFHMLKDAREQMGLTGEQMASKLRGFEPPPKATNSGRYIMQPYSRNAPNPPEKHLQDIVDNFHAWKPGKTLYAVGRTDTPQTLRGLDYSLLEDSAPAFIRHVAAAKMVFTPHSAAAHIAAAYRVKAFVWCPDWSENWQLNYPDWDVDFAIFEDPASKLILPTNGVAHA
jgi:hypothetical protein